MHPLASYLTLVLPSLVAASDQLPEMRDAVINPASKLEIHVHGPIETFNIVYPPSKEHNTHPWSFYTQSVLPITGWCTLGIVITTILFVSTVWLLRKHLGDPRVGARDHSTRRAGRSEAVSGPVPGNDEPPLHDNDLTKPCPRLGRCAAVAVVDNAYVPPLRKHGDIMILFEDACNFIEGRVTYPLPPIIEEPEELDSDSVAHSQGTTTPGGGGFQAFSAAGHHIHRTRSWPPIKQVEPTIVCLSVRSPDPNSLCRSLHKGARDLEEEYSLRLDRCVFFLVGVDTLGHEAAENDAEYLRQMLQSPAHGSSVPRYEYLYGLNATRDKIRETTCALFGEARAISPSPQIFMLFTGTGDENNMMCLFDDEALSERDLSDWLPECPDQINEPATSILFDICRMATHRMAAVSQYIEMAWSCSVGQLAYAVCLSKHEDKPFPRSIFLLAIFLAAHHTNVHNQDSHFFEAAFMFHINQLSELILFAYHLGHRDRCPDCPRGGQCDPPLAQNPDLQFAGHAVTNLGMIIATHFPHHAREVFVEVDRRMLQGGFPRRLCPLSDPYAEHFSQPSARRDQLNSGARAPFRAKARPGSVAYSSSITLNYSVDTIKSQ